MTNISPQAAQAVKKPNGMPTPSAVLAGGSLVQMVYEPEKRRTLFAVFRDGEAHYEDTLLMHGQRLVPYSPHHSLIMHEAELIKILNNANAKSFPVLRSDVARGREFDPHAYQVYGPKLVATRGFFEDKALESRCLTEEMGQQRLREDIPLNLTDRYKDDARQLRNRVLLFRFRNVGQKPLDPGLADRALEPRLNQVFIPLLSIIADDQARQALHRIARDYQRQLVANRGFEAEAQILEILRELIIHLQGQGEPSLKTITSYFAERHREEDERKITPRWISSLLKKLGLKTERRQEGHVIPLSAMSKFARLDERYGLSRGPDAAEECSGHV